MAAPFSTFPLNPPHSAQTVFFFLPAPFLYLTTAAASYRSPGFSPTSIFFPSTCLAQVSLLGRGIIHPPPRGERALFFGNGSSAGSWSSRTMGHTPRGCLDARDRIHKVRDGCLNHPQSFLPRPILQKMSVVSAYVCFCVLGHLAWCGVGTGHLI